MKAKNNLKAVDTIGDRKREYTFEDISNIAGILYFVRATLDVLSCLDAAQPGAFEDGAVSSVALEAKLKINEVLDILKP